MSLGVVAVLDWHYALEYIGVLGVLLSLVTWFTSYDSPQVSHGQLAPLSHIVWQDDLVQSLQHDLVQNLQHC